MNDLLIANTLHPHKKSRRYTWTSPDGYTRNQIDYIFIQRKFKSRVVASKTRSYPGADFGSDHSLVMMNLKIKLRRIRKQKSQRIKYNLDKLQDPEIRSEFSAKVGGKFAPLLLLDDVEEMTTAFTEATNETTAEVLRKKRNTRKPWIDDRLAQRCEERQKMKASRYLSEESRVKYREANNRVKAEIRRAKEEWIDDHCREIQDNFETNNTRKSFQSLRELTAPKSNRIFTIKDKNGKVVTSKEDIEKRWTEYAKELYNYHIKTDRNILTTLKHSAPTSDTDRTPNITHSEVTEAINHLKKGKAAGIDNIPAEFLKTDTTTVAILHSICNKMWQSGVWPTQWTKSITVPLPKKGDLQNCSNYRTISLISHPSKVMLQIILQRLKLQIEPILAEEQAGFRKSRSTAEQVTNLRILIEKHRNHDMHLYHSFINFKKAFDRIWHEALRLTLKKQNIHSNLVHLIGSLYENTSCGVLVDSKIDDWFHTTVGVRQGCLLSPCLFNIFLEQIMTEALEPFEGNVRIGGRSINNLRFADDIDLIAGSMTELAELTEQLEKSASAFGMDISSEKSKIMVTPATNENNTNIPITVNGSKLQSVTTFKYLGSNITEDGTSVREVKTKLAIATQHLSKLKKIGPAGTSP